MQGWRPFRDPTSSGCVNEPKEGTGNPRHTVSWPRTDMAEDPTAHPVDRPPTVSRATGSSSPHPRTTSPEALDGSDAIGPSPVPSGGDNDGAGDRALPACSLHDQPAGRTGDPSLPITTDDGVGRTLALWQPRTSRRLTGDDAHQIVENVTGFVQILLEWDAAERSAPDVSRADVRNAGSPGTVRSIQ